MIRFSLFTIILLFFTSISLAQSTTITGLVKDENSETLPGVNVLVKGADGAKKLDASTLMKNGADLMKRADNILDAFGTGKGKGQP